MDGRKTFLSKSFKIDYVIIFLKPTWTRVWEADCQFSFSVFTTETRRSNGGERLIVAKLNIILREFKKKLSTNNLRHIDHIVSHQDGSVHVVSVSGRHAFAVSLEVGEEFFLLVPTTQILFTKK